MLGVIALSLLAAFLFAASAAMQQHAVRGAATPSAKQPRLPWRTAILPVVRLARRLTRNWLWLAGSAANVAGTVVQAGALHLGSVGTVQPVLVTQLLFALPLGSVWDRCWPRTPDWLSAAAICGGLAVFLAVPGTAPTGGNPDRVLVAVAAAAAGSVAGILVAAATGRPAPVHATLIAVAAGLCFAISAVLIKVTLADLVDRGVAATAVDWVGYALAVATVCGFVLEQEAFAAGSLAAAVAAMTITNPVASYLLGVLVFRTGFPAGAASWAALASAALLIGVGVVGLAHSPTVRREKTYPRSQASPDRDR